MHKGRYCKGSGGKNEKAVYDENDQAVKTEDAMDLVDSAQGAVRAPGKRISLPPAQLKSSMLRCAAAASAKQATTLGNEKEEEEKKEKKEIQKEEEKEEDSEGEATVQAEAEKPYVCASCSKTFSSQQASYATA